MDITHTIDSDCSNAITYNYNGDKESDSCGDLHIRGVEEKVQTGSPSIAIAGSTNNRIEIELTSLEVGATYTEFHSGACSS